jgi:hypothetical protein
MGAFVYRTPQARLVRVVTLLDPAADMAMELPA